MSADSPETRILRPADGAETHDQARPAMKLNLSISLSALIISAAMYSPITSADRTIRCESKYHSREICRIPAYGYVRLDRQLSRSPCSRGRTWDYDRRIIWVDDGCRGVFVVENRPHYDDHHNDSSSDSVGAAAAIALIAAAIASGENEDGDENFLLDGHTAYVPEWMVGHFEGYNLKYRAEVSLTIDSDGRTQAWVGGTSLRGRVDDYRLYLGDLEYDIDQAGNGFITTQIGDFSNQVHYQRRQN